MTHQMVPLEDVNSCGIRNLAVIIKGGYACIIINVQCVFLKESPQIYWISATGEVRLLYTSIVCIVEMEDFSGKEVKPHEIISLTSISENKEWSKLEHAPKEMNENLMAANQVNLHDSFTASIPLGGAEILSQSCENGDIETLKSVIECKQLNWSRSSSQLQKCFQIACRNDRINIAS